MPITEVPVKTSSGFHGSRTNVITIVHLVVISKGPVYNFLISRIHKILIGFRFYKQSKESKQMLTTLYCILFNITWDWQMHCKDSYLCSPTSTKTGSRSVQKFKPQLLKRMQYKYIYSTYQHRCILRGSERLLNGIGSRFAPLLGFPCTLI